MNLKFEEGQLVKLTGRDDKVSQGAIGTVTRVSIGSLDVLWGGISALKANYRHRNGIDEVLTTTVSPKNVKVVNSLSPWLPEPNERYYINDCIKYVGEDTKDYKYGDLFCVYAMDYSKCVLSCIKLDNYNLYELNTSDCTLECPHYVFKKGTKVVTIRDSAYTEVGKTGYIRAVDYGTSLPYLVKLDDGGEVWVAGCTITDAEKDMAELTAKQASVDPVLENGFSREVTFYEKD